VTNRIGYEAIKGATNLTGPMEKALNNPKNANANIGPEMAAIHVPAIVRPFQSPKEMAIGSVTKNPVMSTASKVGRIAIFWLMKRTQTSCTPQAIAASNPKIKDEDIILPSFHD
jgi:hypothetical protein